MLARYVACSLILTACLLPVAAQDPVPEKDAPAAVTPEQAKAAAATLKEGLASKEAPARVDALRAAAAVDHDDVAKVAGDALADKEESVRLAAAELLGGMHCEDSLIELHRAAEKKKNIEDSRTAAAFFKAIGRHGDKSSIKVLCHEPLKNMDADLVRARIFALGNIRAEESIEQLMELMQLGNPLPGQDSPFMPTFRVALARLTGTDQTTNKDLWQAWWRDNKGKFKVSPTPPELPPELQSQWDQFWGASAAGKDAGESKSPDR